LQEDNVSRSIFAKSMLEMAKLQCATFRVPNLQFSRNGRGHLDSLESLARGPPLVWSGASRRRPVRLAYQPPASSTFLSKQISHQQPANSTFLSKQTSTGHQPPANRTCYMSHTTHERAESGRDVAGTSEYVSLTDLLLASLINCNRDGSNGCQLGPIA
jgi:hypothetical protein